MSLSRTPIVVLVGALLLAPALAAQSLRSPFIDPMPALEASPVVQGALRWQSDGADFAGYDKVMLDRVQFFLAEDAAYKGIDPAELAAVGASLLVRVTEALEPDYPVVDTAGPGVLRLRIALTEVRIEETEAEKPAKGIFGFTPIGFTVNTISASAARDTDLSGARLEVEALDGASGARIGVFVDPEPAERVEGDKSWETMQKAFAYYAGRLRMRFDADRGK